jgi:hypothetical protein
MIFNQKQPWHDQVAKSFAGVCFLHEGGSGRFHILHQLKRDVKQTFFKLPKVQIKIQKYQSTSNTKGKAKKKEK